MSSKLEINWFAWPEAEFSCAEMRALRVSVAKTSDGDCSVETVFDVPVVVAVASSVADVCPSVEVAEVDEVEGVNRDST